ncbi:hypothetical protein [Shewanella japonica]|uniref:hypothetical protein n=1 Tax=Shewanella japonica TaxID=93973 RepID=UPI0024940BA9|nr:hypothetical protein [Shewanella japonica]
MKFYVYLLAGLFLLSGCASNNIERAKSITSEEPILVLSQFPDEFQVKTVGFTVFGNDLFYLDINDWQLNDYVENKFESLISADYQVLKNPELRFQVAKPDYNYFTLEKYPLKNKELDLYVKNNNVKYVLLISPMKYKADPYFGTNQHINDFGVYQGKRTIAFLQMHFWLYDATTGNFVASGGYGGYTDDSPSWIGSSNLYFPKKLTSEDDVDLKLKSQIENKIKGLFDTLLARNVSALKLKTNK